MPYPDAKYPYDQRLVRAAPELLRLLHAGSSVVGGLEADCDEAGIDSQRARWWWQDAVAAIEQAEGRTDD